MRRGKSRKRGGRRKGGMSIVKYRQIRGGYRM